MDVEIPGRYVNPPLNKENLMSTLSNQAAWINAKSQPLTVAAAPMAQLAPAKSWFATGRSH